MYQSVRDAFYDFNVPFEGVINWMYLDIKGLVTIGVGNLIDPIDRAINLPFEYAGEPDSFVKEEEIRNAWQTAKSNSSLAVKGAKAFKSLSNLRLSEKAIRSLVDSRLTANETFLKGVFGEFENFPADAQLALLSMAWAMGAGFASKFPKLRSACLSEDWDSAGEECSIREVGNPGVKPRNEADRTLFSNAARVVELGETYGYQTDTLYYPTVILREVVVTPEESNF